MKTTLTAVAALMIAISPLAAQTPAAAPAPAPFTFVAAQLPTEVLGTDFWGTPVVGKDKQQIGKVKNLVFDHTGHIDLVVVGVGGVLGIGDKEVAVPFDAIKGEVVNGKNVFEIDATKEQLKDAPAYKTLNDQAFNERLATWRSKATQSWNDMKSKAGQAYEEAKGKAGEAYEKAKDKAGEAYDKAKDKVAGEKAQ
jgi:hypothetical protein